jgi:hypothetical protein
MSFTSHFTHQAKQLTIALSLAALSALAFTPASSANNQDQQSQTPSNPQVRIETPASGARVHGNVTFTGLAVDCTTSQAASGVAVYDGVNNAGTYLADVSMDTTRANSDGCGAGKPGSSQSGFTLIFDSNRLSDGRHTLAFVARFPGGATQTVTTEVNVDNVPTPTQPVVRYPAYYSGVYQGGYWTNNVYTPLYTRCSAYNAFGACVAYTNVAAPIVTPAVYPGCTTNLYGQCIAYPYTTNPYYAASYLSNLYTWNGYTWIRR